MANKQQGALPQDIRAIGSTDVLAAAPFNDASVAYEASHIFKSKPGILYGLSGFNSKGSAQWVQIFDANRLPADGGVPLVTFTVPTVANFSVDFGVLGMRFNAGIVVCNSSTGPTKTIGSADCFFTGRFR